MRLSLYMGYVFIAEHWAMCSSLSTGLCVHCSTGSRGASGASCYLPPCPLPRMDVLAIMIVSEKRGELCLSRTGWEEEQQEGACLPPPTRVVYGLFQAELGASH